MSEPVGGKSGRTLPSDPVTSAARRLQFDIGSRIPIRVGVVLVCRRIRIRDTNAARRLLFDTGSRIPMRLGVFLGGTGENRISDINAARRLLLVIGCRISMQLGVSCVLSDLGYQCGSASLGRRLSLDLNAARRRLGDVCHWIGWILMNSDAF